MAAKPGSGIGKKIGPLPAWGWAVTAAVIYFVFKRFASGGTSAAVTSPSSVGTGTPTGAPASGQGGAADNLTADLLAQAIGSNVAVNSNLVTGLLGAVSSIEGLGTAALNQSGAVEEAIVNGKLWGSTSSTVNVNVTGGGSSGGAAAATGSGGGAGGSGATSYGSALPAAWTATPVQALVPGGGGKLVAP